MSGATISRKQSPSKVVLCPQCDSIMVADYLPEMRCPHCQTPLFEQDMIYMPDIQDAYRIAQMKVTKKRMKARGMDYYDDDA